MSDRNPDITGLGIADAWAVMESASKGEAPNGSKIKNSPPAGVDSWLDGDTWRTWDELSAKYGDDVDDATRNMIGNIPVRDGK